MSFHALGHLTLSVAPPLVISLMTKQFFYSNIRKQLVSWPSNSRLHAYLLRTLRHTQYNWADERLIRVIKYVSCRCYHKFRFHHLTPCLVAIVSLLLILILHQFLIINEFQIIHFKHRQGVKPLSALSDLNVSELFPFGQASGGQLNSLCSSDADRRGPHQKVISYSIYGDFSRPDVANKYLKPFRNTINEIPVIYPGIYASHISRNV